MKRSRIWLIKFTVFVLIVSTFGQQPYLVSAQDPVSWQTTATGLATQNNPTKKTAGLGFIVDAKDWPSLSLKGGVKADNTSYRGPKLAGPTGIDLGQIRVPNSSGLFLNEEVDWAHNKMSYEYGTSGNLDTWVSRLSSAILIHSNSNELLLFTGNVSGNTFNGTNVNPRPDAPSFPKYVAYSAGGVVRAQTLSSAELPLSNLDKNWILLWYGNYSHFVDTKYPMTYSWTIPQDDAYQADAPTLIVFETNPTSIKQSDSGGVQLSFQVTSGYVTILPLFGRDILRASDTEQWGSALPSQVSQKAQWWADHICSYPVGVNETYSYNENTDSANINESISYLNVCSSGTQFAPIPPFLGIVKDTLGVSFSGTVIDGGINTEYGPSLGIENTQAYTWSVLGLKKYTDGKRIITGAGQALAALDQEMSSEVQNIISAGHFAPWLFMDKIPTNFVVGDAYWLNPADSMIQLTEIADVLSSDLKNQLINYIKSERMNYPPEVVYNLPLDQGTTRTGFMMVDQKIYEYWASLRPDVYEKNVPLYNFYALSKYYNLTQETVSAQTWQNAQEALDREMREQDWATSSWFKGFEDRRIAVSNSYRHFAGLIGYINLAKDVGDKASENLGRVLLAKAAVLSAVMVKYQSYLYSADLVELPPQVNWQPEYIRDPVMAYVYNYYWAGPDDDARQIIMIDQYGVYLYDHSGYQDPDQGGGDWILGPACAHLVAYIDLSPELARFFDDYLRPEAEISISKIEALFPHWYASFAEGALGVEHDLSHPIDSFQIFMAKALIQHDTSQNLTKYIDIPWLREGDLFYIRKLAETIRSYRGTAWDNSIQLQGTPGNNSIYLNWDPYVSIPDTFTFQISYEGPAGDQPSPVAGIPATSRHYDLTGLTNYTTYKIWITAMDGTNSIMFSTPIYVMPSEYITHLPLISNKR